MRGGASRCEEIVRYEGGVTENEFLDKGVYVAVNEFLHVKCILYDTIFTCKHVWYANYIHK